MAKPGADQLNFEKVDQQVKQYMFHPFLQASEIRQSVSRFHFDVGRAILTSANVPLIEAQNVLTAVLLLHQGLSIHDEVDNLPPLKRQLSVLAGDYDSSWYYWVLARVGDMQLMSALSEAVVSINEAKMAMYLEGRDMSPEHYMEIQVTIQGQLLFALARHYLSDAVLSMAQLHSLVRAYVVSEETKGRKSPRHYTLRQAHSWMSEALERMLQLPANAILEPIAEFVVEYLIPVKNALEHKTLVEGNR